MPEFQPKEKITFTDIVFEAIHEVGRKALVEFRGEHERTLMHGNWSETIMEPDARNEYIQSIEHVYNLLYATIHDKDFYATKYKKYFAPVRDDSDKLMKEAEELLNAYDKEGSDYDKYITKKLRIKEKIFRILMVAIKYCDLGLKGGAG